MRAALVITTLALLIGGCSNTWQGVKEDSSKVWKDTKKVVHDATAE